MLLFGLRDDLREAFHRIRRNPRTSLVAVGTLALGIGAATAILTVAHTCLMAPPPFREPDRIVRVHGPRTSWGWQGVSGADFLDYLEEPGLFQSGTLVGYAEFSWTGQSLPGFDGAEVLRGYVVTADYFRVMDHPMAAGRGFLSGEEHAVVISHALWQRRFAGRGDIIGQAVTINGTSHVVVGVAGRGFLTYGSYEVMAWVPISPDREWRSSRQYSCFARLAPGIGLEQVQQRLDVLNRHLAEAYPATNAKYAAKVEPFLHEVRQEVRPAMLALLAGVLCLLLIVVANVASLLLARAAGQAREMAIRTALGASRLRLYRMVIAESCLLALVASVGGVALGAWLITGLRELIPATLAVGWAFALDARVFAAAFLLSALAGLTAGVAPAFESFRMAAGGIRPTISRSRLLRGITTVEIALAVVLAIGAGLLGKSFLQLLDRPLGYRTDSLLGMRVRLVGDRYKSIDQRAAYWSELMERASTLPGIAKSAMVSDLPMGWQYSGGSFEAADKPVAPGETRPRAHQIVASPGYFATLGIPLLAGRGFNEGDGPKSEPVVIVNDFLAQKIWPGENAIGKRIKAWDGKTWRRVVGVVYRVRHGGPADQYENQLYVPYRQGNSNVMFLVVRTHVPPESVVPAIRTTLKFMDPNVPAFEIRSMKAAFERETALPRLPMALTVGFAGLAALLAALGLFGVIAYWVSRRTKELGIRAAIGARPAELRALVLRQGLRMAAIGLTAGVAVSLTVMRYLHSLLYGMSERDPWIYAGAIALALGTAIFACWLPASRAARVDPARALREEG
ncbi:MAG TPA: ABC transporter permease [Bryobacteraceae bacterium]|nr:ABC transporter permease [Bryobacteraceae bacterium]